MKNTIFSLLFIVLLLSCTKNDDTKLEFQLIGRWKLIEVLADPGDGNGTFQPVESYKTIEFESDGTFIANSYLCDSYSNGIDEIYTTGVYSLTRGTLTTDCQDPNYSTIYYKLENRDLILDFTSNEGYSLKLKKID